MADIILKPCPFCGGEATITQYGNNRQSTQYLCDNCGCFLETSETWGFGTDWNKRHNEKENNKIEYVDLPEEVITSEIANAVFGIFAKYRKENKQEEVKTIEEDKQ